MENNNEGNRYYQVAKNLPNGIFMEHIRKTIESVRHILGL